MPVHELVDSEAGQSLTVQGGEDWLLGIEVGLFGHQLLQENDGLLPQWADPPFIAFAVKVSARPAFKFEVLKAEIRNLLNPGSGVVKEQKKSPIT